MNICMLRWCLRQRQQEENEYYADIAFMDVMYGSYADIALMDIYICSFAFLAFLYVMGYGHTMSLSC